MTLFLFNWNTNDIVVIINGATEWACEDAALKLDYYPDDYGWSYNRFGLKESENTKIINIPD